MPYPIYQVDAFTDKLFGGNPACVVPLDKWFPDEQLMLIAAENAVPETAFFIPNGDSYHLRWFTPDIEMDLCGHATLATAHVLFNHMQHSKASISFNTQSGLLAVKREGSMLILDFPSRMPSPAILPDELMDGLNIKPKEIYKARDYVLVYDSEDDIRQIKPDREKFNLINIDPGGVIVTAQGENVDFVSRFFTPRASIFEDPVTGSAHCSLTPFWAERLGKTRLSAMQLSDRIGKLLCELKDNRVLLKGQAITYMQGDIEL
ncbi:MAG: PhzF family phenazine biosynthesis protein [Prevotellaceae bacterium]|jgi:PhzF family phenazine biosynthesis protein|nr:PhzF family phenazine biosynthesis protein [Prevotellaceae bacterium]